MIFLYHSIVPDSAPTELWCAGQALPFASFKSHILSLARRFRIVPLAELLENSQRKRPANRMLALTFDDGLGTTFQQVNSFLNEQNIPATFFVTTDHLEHGRPLWFSYLNALCYENTYESVNLNGDYFPLRTIRQRKLVRRALGQLARASGDPSQFSKKLSEIYPLPAEVKKRYEGMTYEQLRTAGRSNLIEIGSHTLTHPYLSQKSNNEQAREIIESKSLLSKLTGKRIRYFAYPGGDYNRDTLHLVRKAGYEAAFATISLQMESASKFEIERIGIYSPSLLKLNLKAIGVAKLARQVGLRIG
jgi:peptidoglycan/xylan/chitin deacetylase (PgdA/CDA1 family)